MMVIIPPREIRIPLGDNYGGIERIVEDLYNHIRSTGERVELFDWSRYAAVDRAYLIDVFSGYDAVLDFTHLKELSSLADPSRYLAYSFATDRLSFKRDVAATRAVRQWFVDALKSIDIVIAGVDRECASEYASSMPVVYPGISNVYHRGNDEGYVLFLGRIAPFKGVHIAIHAASMARRRIVVAGHTGRFADANYVDMVRKMADQHQNVDFRGDVTAREKADLLSHACCLVAPSDWRSLPGKPPESFGIVVVEALLSGIPAVVPRESGMEEIIGVGESDAGVAVDAYSVEDDHARARMYADGIERAAQMRDSCRCRERGLYFTPGRFWDDLRRVM
ncbi:MAG: glycosyltransferase [Anaerolineae bacterium]